MFFKNKESEIKKNSKIKGSGWASASTEMYYNAPVAKRGYIYEFLEKDGSYKNDVLVVSSDGRGYDKIISIIMLGDNPSGYDVVKVNYDGRTRFVHRELVTYCARARLGKCICKVSDKVMADIDTGLARGLGLA